MRTQLRRILPALVCTLTLLALPVQSRAGGDDTNAALITDGTTWAQSMGQVMGGTSPTGLPQPGMTIRGPTGIYAHVLLKTVLPDAHHQAKMDCSGCSNPNVDQFLKNYFGNLLSNPAISGIQLEVKWNDLQPLDAGNDPLNPNKDSFDFSYLDDAFNAIIEWNNNNPSQPPKTLMLVAIPGFHSPLNSNTLGTGVVWLLSHLNSCDGLFRGKGVAVPPGLAGCGYTSIFWDAEDFPPGMAEKRNLPMPWNTIYKKYWQSFLRELNQHITSSKYEDVDYASVFVSIGVGGPTASSNEMILPNGADNPGLLKFFDGTGNAVTVYEAWNCLLGNNYGVAGNCLSKDYGLASGSSYINSDRAFIEEWAAAIDMYGQVFSGITLIVARGNGLPNFPTPSNPYLLQAPPAFAPNCGTTSMDCAAENAIIAYFAGPPIGGPNAKATTMAGLKAGDLTLGTGSASRPGPSSGLRTRPLTALRCSTSTPTARSYRACWVACSSTGRSPQTRKRTKVAWPPSRRARRRTRSSAC
jgi:hypothetical protein